MAASAVQNPPTQGESKSAKKKKAKAAATIERTDSPAPTASPAPERADAGDDASEPLYVRDIHKNIRNINKKITNMAKTEAVVAENPDKSLDDLLAAKLINADQKAQISKKPVLLAQVAQLEEQVAQYKKIDQEYRTRGQADKAELEKAFADRLEKEKTDAVDEIKAKLEAEHAKNIHDTLLGLSQFLRLAAARRSEDVDPTLDENLALEGVLLGVYGGDNLAVECMIKLTQGSDDQTQSVSGDVLQTTFAQVQALAQTYSSIHAEPEAEAQEVPAGASASEDAPVATDPTVANASLTEIRAGQDVALTNGHVDEQAANGLANGDVATGTANAAGEKWDTGNNEGNDLSASAISGEWVNVSKDSAEVEPEPAVAASAAPVLKTQSWADDHPETTEPAVAQADPNDGFHQVQGRNRGRNDRDGGNHWRGGRGRGSYRGDGRGRGRGGHRGGSMRGPRRGEES